MLRYVFKDDGLWKCVYRIYDDSEQEMVRKVYADVFDEQTAIEIVKSVNLVREAKRI